MKKVIVAISGASGFRLGIKAFRSIPSSYEKHLILSQSAQKVASLEEDYYPNDMIEAPMASGSFGADIMLVVPCSMNTLAKVAVGIADNLITRAASVMIKERKTLLLAPRELPLSPIALENMHKLSQLGVIIAPPILAYYSEQQTLEEMEKFIIGKWFDAVGIKHDLYKRWQ